MTHRLIDMDLDTPSSVPGRNACFFEYGILMYSLFSFAKKQQQFYECTEETDYEANVNIVPAEWVSCKGRHGDVGEDKIKTAWIRTGLWIYCCANANVELEGRSQHLTQKPLHYIYTCGTWHLFHPRFGSQYNFNLHSHHFSRS